MKIFSIGCKLYSSLARTVSPHTLICNFGAIQHIKTMPFYAVAKGVVPGVYTEWSECQKQTVGFRGPQFKKFNTREEAEEFISQKTGNVVDKRKQETKPAAAASGDAKDKKKGEKGDDSALPPHLLAMKLELKQHQKELSLLRQRFDSYVSALKASPTEGGDSNGAAKGKKRARTPDDDDDAEADSDQSSIKKRVSERVAPDKDLFEVDDSGSVVVYTDGCCEFNGKHGAKAGIGVFFGADNPLNLSEPVRGRATNNTAEIQAITFALELIKRAGFSKALINTDSQFVINCMTSWMTGWKKRGWKKSDGSPVINKEDLIDLDKASDGLMVKYNHVKAHSGIEGNERADQLAKAGSKSYDANITE